MRLTRQQIDEQKLTILCDVSKDPAIKKFRPVMFPIEVDVDKLYFYEVLEFPKTELLKPAESLNLTSLSNEETEVKVTVFTGEFHVFNSAGEQIYNSKSSV